MSVPTLVHAADADADGMDDAWEVSMGLSATNATDAFTDKDGDRVPNLWEYVRGTAANSAASFPAYDAIVTTYPASGVTPPEFATLQEAYDSLSGASGTYYLVQVKHGVYPAELSLGAEALRVAWIAETGANRVTGLEGVVLSGSANGYDPPFGLEFGDDTLFNGFVVDGASTYPVAPAVRTFAVNGASRICLLNTIIRYWSPYFDWLSPYTSSAICNEGAILRLLHCTVARSVASVTVPGSNAAVIENKTGSTSQLRIFNSLIWGSPDYYPNNQSTYQIVRGDVSKVWVTTSHLQGLSSSGFNTTQVPTTGNSANWPNLSLNGYIQTGSPTTAKTGGSAQGVMKDIHNQTRPTANVAMGVMQLVDSDADTLPDWWEHFWFGSLIKANTGNLIIADPDGDGTLNFDEYMYAAAPTDDQDGDGLPDWWELQYFGTMVAYGVWGNPDGDEATNFEEFLLGGNPVVAELDADSDGWNDAWERQTFDTLTESLLTDFDGDGLVNGFELTYGSNPELSDTNGDGISDGLAFYLGLAVFNVISDADGDGVTNSWEIDHGTNPFMADTDNDGVPDAQDALPLDPLASTGISVAGPPVITLTSPPNAILQP